MIALQTTTPSPSDEAVQRFTEALVYADSIALGVAVLLLLIAIVFRASTLEAPARGRLKELVVLSVGFSLIGDTALLNAYPDSAIIKAFGYLVVAAVLTWRFGRAFERHVRSE